MSKQVPAWSPELGAAVETISTALGCTGFQLAQLGFDEQWQVRFIFKREGRYHHFDMPTHGPFWDALVELVKGHR